MTEEEKQEFYNKQIREAKKELLLEQLRRTAPEPTQEEIKNYYDQNKYDFMEQEKVVLQYIVIKSNSSRTLEEANKTALGLRNRKENFTKLADKYSEDYNIGGKEQVFSKDDLPEGIKDKIFSLEVNLVSEPIINKNNVFIFKINEKYQKKQRNLDEVREIIIKELLKQKQEDIIDKFVESLRRTADVNYHILKPMV